jgi:chaperonin GroES
VLITIQGVLEEAGRLRPHHFVAGGRSTMATGHKGKFKISPLADRVVIRPLEETEQMRGGLYIPDTAKEKPQQGEVIAVGPGRIEKGDHVKMEVTVGDKVLYGKYSGTEVTIDNETLLIVKESDVLAVVG